MKDLGTHLFLFVLASAVIVIIGAFYAEPDDSKALASLPKRLGTFLFGCAVVTAVMLICEHTFAKV